MQKQKSIKKNPESTNWLLIDYAIEYSFLEACYPQFFFFSPFMKNHIALMTACNLLQRND